MSVCRSCGAPILWATSAATGKKMPLDREPSAEGNTELVLVTVDLFADQDEERAVVLTGLELDEERASGRPLYVSHFVTCPNADNHRRSA